MKSIESLSHIWLRWFCLLSLGLAWFGLPQLSVAERSIKLAWNAGTDASAAGYKVYALEENANQPIALDVGFNGQAEVKGLKEGLEYTFYVTAYNFLGMESPPSSPIAYRVPVPMQMTPSSVSNPGKIRFPAAPGRWYELEASTDMLNWTTIWQTGVANSYSWIEYQDPRARYYTSRFYRLKVH